MRAISTNGTITTVAGGGSNAPQAPEAATKVELGEPTQIAVGPDGSLYIADEGFSTVDRVDSSGMLSVLDLDPTTEHTAGIQLPVGIAVTSSGEVLVSDAEDDEVVSLGPSGVTVVAGNGQQTGTDAGDGGQATDATLVGPTDLSIAPDGDLYITELSGFIRVVYPNGTIETAAGGGPNAGLLRRRAGDGAVLLPHRCLRDEHRVAPHHRRAGVRV